jgi:hypothetical protein
MPTPLSRRPTIACSEGRRRAGCTQQPHSCVGRHPLRPGYAKPDLTPPLASHRRTPRPPLTNVVSSGTRRYRCQHCRQQPQGVCHHHHHGRRPLPWGRRIRTLGPEPVSPADAAAVAAGKAVWGGAGREESPAPSACMDHRLRCGNHRQLPSTTGRIGQQQPRPREGAGKGEDVACRRLQAPSTSTSRRHRRRPRRPA